MKGTFMKTLTKKITLAALALMICAAFTLVPQTALADTADTTAQDSVTTTEQPAAPVVTFGTKTTSSISMTWTSVEGAQYYRVYTAKSGKYNYKKVAEQTDTAFTKTGLSDYTTYKYRVRAYYTDANGDTAYVTSKTYAATTSMKQGRAKIMSVAKSKLGCAYVSGAEGPNRFDCSGYVYYCYKKANVSTKKVSRTSAQGLYNQLKKYNIGTSLKKASKGDIVLCGSSKGSISHAAMAYSNTKIINAANPRKGVCVMPARYFHIVAIIHLPMK
jgi:cell wall-associated NlpC family hydrolase